MVDKGRGANRGRGAQVPRVHAPLLAQQDAYSAGARCAPYAFACVRIKHERRKIGWSVASLATAMATTTAYSYSYQGVRSSIPGAFSIHYPQGINAVSDMPRRRSRRPLNNQLLATPAGFRAQHPTSQLSCPLEPRLCVLSYPNTARLAPSSTVVVAALLASTSLEHRVQPGVQQARARRPMVARAKKSSWTETSDSARTGSYEYALHRKCNPICELSYDTSAKHCCCCSRGRQAGACNKTSLKRTLRETTAQCSL